MLRRLHLPMIALALPLGFAMPLVASEPQYSAGERVAGNATPQPRKPDRQRPSTGPCSNCPGTSLKRPLLEAPAPALLMIPASLGLGLDG